MTEVAPAADQVAAPVRRQGGRGNPHATPPDPDWPRRKLSKAPTDRGYGWRRRTQHAALHWVRTGPMPRQAYLALCVVLDCSNDYGRDVSSLAIRQLAERLGWAERTMAHWLKWLFDAHWLDKGHKAEQDQASGLWRQLPNRYRPTRPLEVELWLQGVEWLRDLDRAKSGRGRRKKGSRATPPRTPAARPEGSHVRSAPHVAPPLPVEELEKRVTAVAPAISGARSLQDVIEAHRGRRRGPP